MYVVKQLKQCKHCQTIGLDSHFNDIKCINMIEYRHSLETYEEGSVFAAHDKAKTKKGAAIVSGVSGAIGAAIGVDAATTAGATTATAGFFAGASKVPTTAVTIGSTDATTSGMVGGALGGALGGAVIAAGTYGALCLIDHLTKKVYCNKCHRTLDKPGCFAAQTTENMEHQLVFL